MSPLLSLLFLLLAGPTLTIGLEERLQSFRDAMKESGLDGYVVPYSDYHASEYPMDRDKIREWLTGFTGSNGNAALTLEASAIWTDSRYTIQAQKQVSKSWELQKKGKDIGSWLSERLRPGQSVGTDPKRMPFKTWLDIEDKLKKKGIKLVEAADFTSLWKDRPSFPDSSMFIHHNKFNGQSYATKLNRFRQKLLEKNCTLAVVTALTEVAWLLNLRGWDAPYTPVFAAFLIVKPKEAVLYVRSSIVSDQAEEHLAAPEAPVSIKEYDDFWNDWIQDAASNHTVFVPNSASYFIYSAVPTENRRNGSSLVIDLRAYKTATEVESSREAHIYDGIALARLFKTLEKKIIEEKQELNETDVSLLATQLRRKVTPEYLAPSFPNIVASGANGAMPHYTPEPGAEAQVNTSAVVYLDTGGQYLGGTTDVTRTLHFGTPHPLEVDVYTSLLRGVARLGGAVFPEGFGYTALDTLIREPLFQIGLNYGHGSTHGIGVFLSVHEDFNGTYYENFIGSQEPGYYEENNFGMRLENAVVVVPANPKYQGKTEKKFLKFSPLTLVPYEPKLINVTAMDESEIKWLNDYHKEVLDIIGGRLLSLKDKETYDWLVAKTKPIEK